MARAGASESLEQPSTKTRAAGRAAANANGATKAVTEAPAKATKKAAEKKAPEKKAPEKKAPEKKAAPAKARRAAAASADKAAETEPARAKPRVRAAPAPAPPAALVEPKAPKAKKAPGTAAKVRARAARATTLNEARPAPPIAVEGFSAKTLDRLRRLLEEERETYLRQARDLAAEAEALASEREPGDTQFDEESGEGDTLNIERERDLALSASARQAVEEIDRALARMDARTYGVCERCGKKISVARLEALPYAALCIECKSREERRR